MNVLGRTRILGVIGDPVAHSLSPAMHNAAIQALNIDYIYVPFRVLPHNLAGAIQGLRALEIDGLNVTIPHKERLIDFLDEVDDYARRIGSVNTIVNRDGRLRGESTDGPGFLRSAEAAWGRLDGCSTLILGAGGSAKAVAHALAGIGCRIVIANRTIERAEALAQNLRPFVSGEPLAIGLEIDALAQEIGKADLLVNTTSVGMTPDVDGVPIPVDLLRADLMVYDLVYNPLSTRLVQAAESCGARAMNGLKMLVYQGALSFEMWTGIQPPIDVMEQAALSSLDA